MKSQASREERAGDSPIAEKRTHDLSIDAVQRGNARWWTQHPMDYDWHRELRVERSSLEWFDAIDRRFVHSVRLFATEREPFDRVIPFARLKGCDVLEIGCGMGLHTELMARAGARVTAIDLSQTAIEATSRRLQTKGVDAKILLADAEQQSWEAQSFDFVWSWGVIHHSARTASIVRTIARILRPNGECRVMVYNRLGMAARVIFLRDHLLKGGFLRRSWDDTLCRGGDGFSARYYVPEQFEDLFRAFFADVSSVVCGQDADAIPLPRHLRRLVLRLVPESYLRRAQARRGSFIFLTGRSPN